MPLRVYAVSTPSRLLFDMAAGYADVAATPP